MTSIENAIMLLDQDHVVAIPTETVYGLAGKITSAQAIEKIFKTKDRPFFDPLIVHTHSMTEAKKLTRHWDKVSQILAEKFWPGSMTLIMKKNESVSPLITSGLDTVGIRIPNHPLTLELLERLASPLAAPSANKFKQTSPTTPSHVESEFPGLFVLDGGECSVGIESTIIEVSDKAVYILRPGMVTETHLRAELDKNDISLPIIIKESNIAPGHLKHHYMPKIPLIVTLKSDHDSQLESLPKDLLINPTRYTLPDDPAIAARLLYSKLREFDQDNTCIIFELEKHSLDKTEWRGILNRLEKAASHFFI